MTITPGCSPPARQATSPAQVGTCRAQSHGLELIGPAFDRLASDGWQPRVRHESALALGINKPGPDRCSPRIYMPVIARVSCLTRGAYGDLRRLSAGVWAHGQK